MNKTIAFLLTACYLFLSLLTNAQTKKQKAEKEFLNQLNSILINSKDQDWAHNGTMTVDIAFAINKEGILSVTVHYTDDDSAVVRMRMEAPVKKILRVAYDLYLILEYKEDEVAVYESEPGKNELVQVNKSNLFHIGIPQKEGYTQKEKLQKLLKKVLKQL